MNDIVAPVRSLDRDRQNLVAEALEAEAHISPVDRLSLRLGLWLLLRSTRRIHRVRSHAEHTRLLTEHRAREARETAAAREQLLWGPR